MGDAGPQSPSPSAVDSGIAKNPYRNDDLSFREVNVLVTGFGPFRSFTKNPSYLIASALPPFLYPSDLDLDDVQNKHAVQPLHIPARPARVRPHRINIHTHPQAVRVSYPTVADLIPRLVSSEPDSSLNTALFGKDTQTSRSALADAASGIPNTRAEVDITQCGTIKYDYVFHIGMAGGRTNYTLETLAHNCHYKIKDVDDRDGYEFGESVWCSEGLPEVLQVGWNQADVLERWQVRSEHAERSWEDAQIEEARRRLSEGAKADVKTDDALKNLALMGKGRRAEVKLSQDAGRYLCEFILYTSLAQRWREARGAAGNHAGRMKKEQADVEDADEKVGKVAFLHVPGATGPFDIARGVRVAACAILALVESWESGYRDPELYA